MQNLHSFNKLTDFFGEPQDFRDFTMVRKPSIMGDDFLLESSMSLEIDFIADFDAHMEFRPEAIPELQLSGFELPNEPSADTVLFTPPIADDSAEPVSSSISHRTKPRSNETPRQKKKFENKNSARNIVRKTIRCIESGRYEQEVLRLCAIHNQDYKEFRSIMSGSFEEMTGPQALRKFFEVDDGASRVFRQFLQWFLKERYIREALREGHMENIKQYVEFKNRQLLPALMRL